MRASAPRARVCSFSKMSCVMLMIDEFARGALPATDPVAARSAQLQHDRRDGPVVSWREFDAMGAL